MPFETSAGRENGYYGKYTYDLKNGVMVFYPLGREILLTRMAENIENKSVTWTLSFEFEGAPKTVEISRKDIADSRVLIAELASVGADVHPKHFNIILDTLRQQQELIEDNHAVARTYEHLGWIRLPDYDSTGQPIQRYCYRGSKLIGNSTTQATYKGPYMVKPAGSSNAWKQGVIDDVIGHTPLEIVLLGGLSAVVNGLIAPYTTSENPIIHVCGTSGTGKTTGAELAVSVSCAPFAGSSNGCQSLLRVWGSTANSIIRRCEGNRGAVIALNEIGQCDVPDMTRIVYHLGEGTDKERLSTDLKANLSETCFTVFISTGEMPLLGRCKTKAEGLWIRVMEITDPLTEDAAHANRIKTLCHSNFGHAAPMLAQHIIDNGGIGYVLPIYQRYCQDLVDKFPENHFRERFIAKFPALFLTTAEIATETLGIPFDKEHVLDYFIKYAQEHSDNTNSPLDSYNVILHECRENINCFYRNGEAEPRGKVWGKVSYPKGKWVDNKLVAEEYSVRPPVIERILTEHGFRNPKSCVQKWMADGVLDYEDTSHPYRKRKIVKGGTQERVYVFRVFADPNTVEDTDTTGEPELPKIQLLKRKSTSQMAALLADEEEDNNGIA